MSWHTDVKHVPDHDTDEPGAAGDNLLYVFKPALTGRTAPPHSRLHAPPAPLRRAAGGRRTRRGGATHPQDHGRREQTVGLRPRPQPSPKRAAKALPSPRAPEGYTTPRRASPNSTTSGDATLRQARQAFRWLSRHSRPWPSGERGWVADAWTSKFISPGPVPVRSKWDDVACTASHSAVAGLAQKGHIVHASASRCLTFTRETKSGEKWRLPPPGTFGDIRRSNELID